ncbi:hypothetical protein DSM104299_05704 [Baekduia alba]|uniref:hypothetical protein n=1 Tax=Baekduia alba TaxID=2997333 RepID=UPI00233FC13A|nr:hypothetical protein [Baekduia alba]WCB96934.1 hypothetical protein DSM104299_05704 [Baekduia alba]
MSAAAPTRSRRGRRVAAGLAVVLVLLAAVAAVAAAPGELDSFPRARLVSHAQQDRAPRWTRPCWAVARWSGYTTCLHVAGRVVWRQGHDGDGDGDRHLFVVSRFHMHVVKLPRELPTGLPTVGDHVDAVGWMARGGHGRTELDAVQLRWSGRLARGRASG